MSSHESDKRFQALETIQYKILKELSEGNAYQGKLVEELRYVREQLKISLDNEKKLLQLKQKQDAKIKELEQEIQNQKRIIQDQKENMTKQDKQLQHVTKKYERLNKTKAMKLTHKYWDLRKKIGLRGK